MLEYLQNTKQVSLEKTTLTKSTKRGITTNASHTKNLHQHTQMLRDHKGYLGNHLGYPRREYLLTLTIVTKVKKSIYIYIYMYTYMYTYMYIY